MLSLEQDCGSPEKCPFSGSFNDICKAKIEFKNNLQWSPVNLATKELWTSSSDIFFTLLSCCLLLWYKRDTGMKGQEPESGFEYLSAFD
jgi:hypothetical protein